MLAFKEAACHSDSKALLCVSVAGICTAGKNLAIKVHARGDKTVRRQAKSQKWLLKAQVTPEVVRPEEDLVDNRLSATVSDFILENILRWTVLHSPFHSTLASLQAAKCNLLSFDILLLQSLLMPHAIPHA